LRTEEPLRPRSFSQLNERSLMKGEESADPQGADATPLTRTELCTQRGPGSTEPRCAALCSQLAISRDHRQPRPLPGADARHLVGVRVGLRVRVGDLGLGLGSGLWLGLGFGRSRGLGRAFLYLSIYLSISPCCRRSVARPSWLVAATGQEEVRGKRGGNGGVRLGCGWWWW